MAEVPNEQHIEGKKDFNMYVLLLNNMPELQASAETGHKSK